MNKLHDELNKTKALDSNFEKTQKHMKEAVMNAYEKKQKKSNMFTMGAKRSAISLAAVGVIAFGVVGSGIISNSLTTQQVFAQAQENIEKQNEGRYVKSVIKSTAVFDGLTEEFTITTWSDTESEDHRSIVTDKDGEVLDTTVYKDGKLYVSENQGVIIGADGAESGELVPHEDGSDAQSVFFETDEEFEDFIANNDVEVIDITDQDLAEAENGFIEVELGTAVQAIGSPNEKVFERLEDIQSENDPNSRLELLQRLAQEDGAVLSESIEWEGFTTHKVTVDGFSMYFAADSLNYVGSEQSINEPGFEASFKDVIVEESYSNDPIDLTIDGLVEAESIEIFN